MKYHIITYGCQMNTHDSEIISGVLEKHSYRETNNLNDADLIILNTCCVRENAERKVYGRIGNLKYYKRKNPNLVIAVTGCMVQLSHVTKYISEKLPYVDLLFGIRNIEKLPQYIEDARDATSTLIKVNQEAHDLGENLPVKREDNIKAWVTITYGCNNFCSYCIVPYVRGREESRKPHEIIEEVKQLARKEYSEMILLGQNVNSYGKDLDDNITFPKLLRKINKIDGIKRIRFLTSHPKDLSDELIFAMRDCEKVCEHIHLPVQSGSNRILEKMNRKYTREHYIKLIEKLRYHIPSIAITTDIIVGFPGETEQDFQDTLDLVKTIEFDSAFTFIYSKRKGTPAAKMEDQVDDIIKKERLNKLMKLQDSISAKKNYMLKGKTLEVLVEGRSKNNPERLSGRTRTIKLVNFKGTEDLIGKLVNVRIVVPHTWSMIGELVN